MIALAILAQGCQHPEPEPSNSPSPPLEQGQAAMPERGTTEVRLSYWGVGMAPPDGPVAGAAARLDGVLSRAGGCVVVSTDGGVRVQPVFPAGKARWNAAAGTLSFQGREYRAGDRITLGGGASPPAFRNEAGVEVAPCEVADLWVVIA